MFSVFLLHRKMIVITTVIGYYLLNSCNLLGTVANTSYVVSDLIISSVSAMKFRAVITVVIFILQIRKLIIKGD